MKLDLEVRDYECDAQGIVNNAVYLQYLEHARHKFLLKQKIDFIKLSKEGKDMVVTEAKYSYHKALRPNDLFHVETSVEFSGKLKLLFKQKIFKHEELILSAEVTGVCVDYKSGKVFKIADIVGPNFPANQN